VWHTSRVSLVYGGIIPHVMCAGKTDMVEHHLAANREVILCGGSLGFSRLLLNVAALWRISQALSTRLNC
jgi:hypothetical protein